MLILDDSASALDFATDAALRKAIRGMNNSPTVFIVSQRAASLMYADLIIVLDDGQVAGMGTHDELLANCEVYKGYMNHSLRKQIQKGVLHMKKNKSTFVKLLKRIKKHSFFIILSLIMAAVTVATTLYVPILVGRGIDCIIGVDNVDFAKIVNILIRIGIFVGITALSQWLMNICNNRITYEVTRDIRNEAIEKIQVLPLKYIDGHSYGEIVSRVIADVDQFADGLLMGFTQFFTGVMTILGTLIFMITINAKLHLQLLLSRHFRF